jgi:hypothetical protein
MNNRTWISKNIGAGIRVGRSFSDWRMAPWRRHEIAKRLQSAAAKAGTKMSLVDAGYEVDKMLDLGTIDMDGNLNLKITGSSRDECVQRIQAAADAWGQPISRSAAEQVFDNARKRNGWTAPLWVKALLYFLIGLAISCALLLPLWN